MHTKYENQKVIDNHKKYVLTYVYNYDSEDQKTIEFSAEDIQHGMDLLPYYIEQASSKEQLNHALFTMIKASGRTGLGKPMHQDCDKDTAIFVNSVKDGCFHSTVQMRQDIAVYIALNYENIIADNGAISDACDEHNSIFHFIFDGDDNEINTFGSNNMHPPKKSLDTATSFSRKGPSSLWNGSILSFCQR